MNKESQPTERLQKVVVENEEYYKIKNVQSSRPFFMSITSAYDHWMFISSNGGLTAGRKNSEYALFPYYTDDKVTESVDLTGSKTILKIVSKDGVEFWEPFSTNQYKEYDTHQNLYKNNAGNRVIFEEVNKDLGLTFRYKWSSSDDYGFIRSASLFNHLDQKRTIEVIDGLINIIPAGIGSELQNSSSNLADAYKRTILDKKTGLGIFALSAIIVDKAEPSEALKANVVWSRGLDNGIRLLSSKQLNAFRRSEEIEEERDVKGEKGAYLVKSHIELASKSSMSWDIIADVNKNHSAIYALIHDIMNSSDLKSKIESSVEKGDHDLKLLIASSDGIQKSSDELKDGRHFANVMFNIMRGGIFDNNYQIDKKDLFNYLKKANSPIFESNQSKLDQLPAEFTLMELSSLIEKIDQPTLTRLVTEYLPLKFSRRHGDPSRPWNKFSINLKNEIDGSKILDYQGNWRDIFQNWEALSISYPAFIDGMVFRFLNASTFDGYNPYRVTKDGFDWEIIEPDDPWSYIGYWGDHQIIYMLKLLECVQKYQPNRLASLLDKDLFVYAAVPYRIKDYSAILNNPKDTVDFDRIWDEEIRSKRDKMGSDGALLATPDDQIYHVNFIEKILAVTLSKVSNLIPDGGIWMNTQRPEWNDANNALVGNGISMVTLYYLYRFAEFFEALIDNVSVKDIMISQELKEFFDQSVEILNEHKTHLSEGFSDTTRKAFSESIGNVASAYRVNIYNGGFSGARAKLSVASIQAFFAVCKEYFEKSIRSNKRNDGLYHAYNILNIEENSFRVSYLSEMLEGQVAALSSGLLTSQETLNLLDSLRKSQLYRSDQSSYILYPNKELPNFLEKNTIPADQVNSSQLLSKMVKDKDGRIIEKDIFGQYHFNGSFRNNNELIQSLDALKGGSYADLAKEERQLILDIYEGLFNHKEFTGRSGTFYAYEGLGSIYWHMVSKLILAIQENYDNAVKNGESKEIIDALADHYYEAWYGLGVHKDPKVYGAFCTDPYSHTPYHKGAQQPGMTGQVKEDILSRFGELGVRFNHGIISFDPTLLKTEEFLTESSSIELIGIDGSNYSLKVDQGEIAFTLCQVPVIYTLGAQQGISVEAQNGEITKIDGNSLTEELSQSLINRSGLIKQINVIVNKSNLR